MRPRPLALFALAAALLVPPVCPPATAQQPARSWSDYRLGQFIASRSLTPGEVLALDNNGDILLACRDGCSREGLLAEGVPALESQLELLRGWALLIDEEAGMRTAIPIVDGERSELLEQRTAALAAEIAGAVAGDVAELVGALKAEGWSGHAFAVVFSYVIDGGVWGFFDEMSLIARRNVARRGAPWGGEVWAYASAREREPRTSTLRRGSTTVKVSWVEPLEPLIDALMTGPLSLQTLFADFLEQGQPASPEMRAKLMEYGIVTSEQRLSVPVIEQSREDRINQLCDRLATRVAEAVIAGIDRPALVAELGLESESQALVIAYHEVMWRLIDRLVATEAIELPVAIADPERARPADLGQLVVMARPPQASLPAGDGDGDGDEDEGEGEGGS